MSQITNYMLDQTSMDTIVEECAHKYAEAEKKDPNIQEIWSTVKKASVTLNKMDNLLKRASRYNNAVNRIKEKQMLYNRRTKNKDNKERIVFDYPFNTDRASMAAEQRILESDDIKSQNYIKNRMQKDIQYINKFHIDLTRIALEGYHSIMHLRELVTNQTIIYAIQGVQGTNNIYQEVVTEDDFVKTLVSKQQYNKYTSLRTLQKDANGNISFKTFSLQMDFERLVSTYKNNLVSRDPLYKAISEYIKGDKQKKLRTSEAWEAYTDARTVFKNKKLDLESEKGTLLFQEFMADWLLLKNKGTFQKIKTSDFHQTEKHSFSTLAFYQGGDTSTSSKYVAIQNKSSSGSFFEAGVQVQSIYQALKYIVEIFQPDYIDVEQVKKLFTAYKLQNISDNIATSAFKIANSYAQEQIESIVKVLNNH